jgi:AcrR family transcriptional regulator
MPGRGKSRGVPATPARRPLTRDRILDAALEICRTEGFLALTMRRIADEIGTSPMAVYGHFGSKAELVGSMLDRIWAGGFLPPEARAADPLERITEGMIRLRRYLLDYGEVAMLAAARPLPSPELVHTAQEVFAVFRDFGLRDDQIPRAFSALASFVMGAVAFEATRALADRVSAIDDEGQAMRLAAFDEAAKLEPAQQAFLAQLVQGADRDAAYELGLRLLLDGLMRWAAADVEPDGG